MEKMSHTTAQLVAAKTFCAEAEPGSHAQTTQLIWGHPVAAKLGKQYVPRWEFETLCFWEGAFIRGKWLKRGSLQAQMEAPPPSEILA